ncbi:hypothetical protein [Francisella sp. TX07-6608]|uniref:hypothetical protein n=1 Tax=Francisella sp. TX07-6608 TaxID=573568 RepID=UPI003B632944
MYFKSIYDLATYKVARSRIEKEITIDYLIKHFELHKGYRKYSNFKDKSLLASIPEINEKTTLNLDSTLKCNRIKFLLKYLIRRLPIQSFSWSII